MDKKLLQDVGPIERAKLLRDSAQTVEEFTYPRALDAKEVTHLKDEYTKNAITMAKHDERKKEFMENWKADVKPLKLEMGEQMTKIRSKVEEITEDVYLVPDFDEGMMGYYNNEGYLVYERPLIGTIGVPLEFLKHHPNWFLKPYDETTEDATVNYSRLLVDRDKMTLTLITEEGCEHESRYEGKLLINPDFEKFGINNPTQSYTSIELAEKIKMNRSFFENKTTAMKLVSQLRDFEAKVNKEVEAKADERANRKVLLAQTVSTNIPEGFKMKLPIFKGHEPLVFEVEIGIDPIDLSCRLISPDANDFINETKNEIIDGQLASIRELHERLRIFEV